MDCFDPFSFSLGTPLVGTHEVNEDMYLGGGWGGVRKNQYVTKTEATAMGRTSGIVRKNPYESIAEATAMEQTDGIVRQSQCESILEATAMGQASGIMSHEMGPKGCEVVGSLLR